MSWARSAEAVKEDEEIVWVKTDAQLHRLTKGMRAMLLIHSEKYQREI